MVRVSSCQNILKYRIVIDFRSRLGMLNGDRVRLINRGDRLIGVFSLALRFAKQCLSEFSFTETSSLICFILCDNLRRFCYRRKAKQSTLENGCIQEYDEYMTLWCWQLRYNFSRLQDNECMI